MKISFRKPSKNDLKSYIEIYRKYRFNLKKQGDKKYVQKIEGTGFLVGDPVADNSWKDAPYSECALVDGRPVGLIRVDKMTSEMESNEFSLKWKGDKKSWQAFTKEKGLSVGVIVLEPEYKSSGIAQDLMNRLINYVDINGIEYLFSWVVSRPNNIPSLKFHKKMGFKELAVYNAEESFGISNYESKLLLREI